MTGLELDHTLLDPIPSTSFSASSQNSGYTFYNSIKSPKNIVAPMVDQSELAWRILSRKYGADLCYTPMFNSKHFYRNPRGFNFALEGNLEMDRPLIVQFCGNDKDELLKSALSVQGQCDAVDLNLGCPQGIAKKGHYGSFLQDEWDLVYSLINHLHKNLDIPVTAKFRIFEDVEKTVRYAQMLESAGAQILTCHGRTRDMKGQLTGLADWTQIAAVKKAVKVPVFANGNIMFASDAARCLKMTGCDGVMTAEGNLCNPAIFSGRHYAVTTLAKDYLNIVKDLKENHQHLTDRSAIKGHLFRMFRTMLERHTEMREELSVGSDDLNWWSNWVDRLHQECLSRNDEIEPLIIEEPDVSLSISEKLSALPYWQAKSFVHSVLSSSLVTKRPHSPQKPEEMPVLKKKVFQPCVTQGCTNTSSINCERSSCNACCKLLGFDGVACSFHDGKEKAKVQRAIEDKERKLEAKMKRKLAKSSAIVT